MELQNDYFCFTGCISLRKALRWEGARVMGARQPVQFEGAGSTTAGSTACLGLVEKVVEILRTGRLSRQQK